MSISELFFKKTRATIGVVQFDVSVSEKHSASVEVTGHPVEEGSEISDHIRALPETVEINGVVTNTPIVYLADLLAASPLTNATGRSDDRVEDAYQELLRIMRAGELVKVVTSLRDYENMVLTSVEVPRDVRQGSILNASISLRQMLIANALTVDLPTPRDIDKLKGTNKKTKKGKQPAEDASDKQSEKSTSILSGLLGGLQE
jgi:hypothetical protein